eukprot:726669-Amphidinium_carterae.4
MAYADAEATRAHEALQMPGAFSGPPKGRCHGFMSRTHSAKPVLSGRKEDIDSWASRTPLSCFGHFGPMNPDVSQRLLASAGLLANCNTILDTGESASGFSHL